MDETTDLPRLTWTILKNAEGRPPAEVAAELVAGLPERSSLQYRNDPEARQLGYFLNDVNVGREVYGALLAILRGRQQRECEAEGHLLPARRCRCGHVSEPGT